MLLGDQQAILDFKEVICNSYPVDGPEPWCFFHCNKCFAPSLEAFKAKLVGILGSLI